MGAPAAGTSETVHRFYSSTRGRSMLVKFEPYLIPNSNIQVAIAKTSDVGWPKYLAPILRDLFDLTNAEIEIMRLMSAGAKVSEIAEQRMISVATVRTQLRSIFAKTDTDSQIECVRLIFGLSSLHETEQGERYAAQIRLEEGNPFYPREDQRHLLTLPDGRLLDYAVFGHPNGTPVLFLHCEVTGDTWFSEAVETAIRLRLKIIAPLRPGYGRSSLMPQTANDPQICAKDARALLDHLQIKTFAIFGVCCGFLYSLAIANLMPDRTKSITVTRPYFLIETEDEIAGFSGFTKWIQTVRLRFPRALRFVVKAGFASVSVTGTLVFATSLLRESPQDIAWVSLSDNAHWTTTLLLTFRYQGYLGTYSDLNYYGPSKHLLIEAPTHVRILIGEHDRNVQWDLAQSWSDRLDHVTFKSMPNSSYLLRA